MLNHNKKGTKMEQRNWVDVDADEQEYLDLLMQFGEGFVDLTRLVVNQIVEKTGETETVTG